MTTISLAANYIDFTNITDGDAFNNVGYGHLQLVMNDQEIEVQAPLTVWEIAISAGIVQGTLTPQAWAAYLSAYQFNNWQIESIQTHSDLGNTPYYNVDGFYDAVDIDITYEDRSENDVWDIWGQIRDQFDDQSEIQYHAGQNSNSYATTLLWMIGINAESYVNSLTTSITGIFDFPGSGSNPLFENAINFNLFGTDHGDIIQTGIGNDTLIGNGGNDRLYAGGGNDTLFGGSGNDILSGGDGFDIADYSGASGIAAALNGSGNAINDGMGGTDTIGGIERIIGSDSNDTFTLSGTLTSFGQASDGAAAFELGAA